MNKSGAAPAGYLLAGGLGALAGGLAVIAATRAIPKMTSKMMDAMMGRMMTQMQAAGCDPSEMWKQMLRGFVEAARKEE